VRSWLLVLACFACLAASTEQRRNFIRVPVWTNSPVTLTGRELVARLNGAPARVLRMQGPGDDLLLLLVLDLVEDLAPIDLARKAMISAARKLPPNTFVGLLRAQDGLRVLLDPSPDRDAFADAVNALPVSGRAGLLDTAETASTLADSILGKASVRVAICYVTDSNIYNYREDFTNPSINPSDYRDLSRRFNEGLVRERISRLLAKLAAHRAPLFVVHLDYRTDRLNEAYQSGLLQIATATGGNAVFCRSNVEIPSAVEKMIETVASHYSVELALPEQAGPVLLVSLECENLPLSYRTRFQLKER